MNSFLQYLLNVSFSILPFYLLYLICFRQLTFFDWNRWYILGSLLISTLIPLISFRAGNTQYLPVQNLPFMPPAGPAPVQQPLPVATTATITLPQVLLIIYVAGALIAATTLVVSLLRIISLIRHNDDEKTGSYRLVRSSRLTMNASFFRYIFVQPNLGIEEEATVILHESAHARKWHTFDVLLLECFKILLWFHPALYHYKKLLQQAHEFEVDQETALGAGKKPYAHLLLKIQSTGYSPVINGYSTSGIAQRIKMLFAERSKTSRKIFYLLIIPCLMITCVYCSRKTTEIQAGLTEVTHGEYGIFEESQQELRYILNPQKIKNSEDYHTFLNKGELKKIDNRFGKYHASVQALTHSKTTGPTEECGFLVSGKGSASASFNMKALLSENMFIELVVEKNTGKVHVRSVGQQAPTERDNSKYKAVINTGKELFLANCAACHTIEKDLTGPALAGIENRRTKEWLYSYIRNNNDLLRAGDPTALKLYNDWKKIPMNTFPDLTNKDIDAMLAYIRTAE